ncbi:hypothetical protein B0H10DRAFT_2058298, partial [Mycena sp. CBHHK59/15]
PEYYDPQPSHDDDVSYDNQDYANAPMGGHGSDTDIPAYHEEGYSVEEDGDVGAMITDCDGPRYEADYLVQGGDEYLLEDEQSPVEDAFAYTAHAPCTFADVLEAEGIYCPDAVAWADEFVRGPPSGECVATWETEMHAWRECIVAGAAPESPSQLTGTETLSLAPPYVPWMADHLDAMQYALQQGHLADERAQAAGWIWDEERGDYWHPDHGYTVDDPELADDEYDLEGPLESIISPDDEPADFRGAPVPEFAAAPASSAFVEYPPSPVDLPAVYNVGANFLEDAFHQAVDILSMRVIPSAPLRAWPPPTTRKCPIRMLVPPPTSTRRTICSQPRVVQQSTSARSKGKTRRVQPRCARSCPDFNRKAPPHLLLPTDTSTPSIATVLADAPVPDTVQCKTIPPDIAGTAVAVSPPPKAPPPTVVSPMSPPIPPDIPLAVTAPAASPSAECRRNALRRIAKKGKG